MILRVSQKVVCVTKSMTLTKLKNIEWTCCRSRNSCIQNIAVHKIDQFLFLLKEDSHYRGTRHKTDYGLYVTTGK